MNLSVVKSLNQGLAELMAQDPSIILLGEDLVDPYGGAFKVTKGLSTRYPDRVISTPMSEAAITGVSAGLAMRGLRPIMEVMFGDFLTLCTDQIVNHIAKYRWMYNDQMSLPWILRTPMGGRRGYGPTHSQTLEKLFCGIPGLRIVAVNRLYEPAQLLRKCVEIAQPVLFIENKMLYPLPRHESTDGLVMGGEIKWSEKKFPTATVSWTHFEEADVTAVAYGGMSDLLLEAARQLMEEDEIAIDVVVPTHIKPFDLAPLVASVSRSGRLAVFEEGMESWGWGREVIYQVLQKCPEIAGHCRARGSREFPIGNAKTLEDATLLQVSDVKSVLRELAI